MIDIAMPRDLMRRRKSAGYAAVCAVGMAADPGVFRLATAENIEAHLPQLQLGTWQRLHFERVLWTPGLAVARTIVIGAEGFLIDARYDLGRHWYRTGLDVVDRIIASEARALRARLWSHRELIDRLRDQSNQEADRFAAGVF